jgi:hypothetical protein
MLGDFSLRQGKPGIEVSVKCRMAQRALVSGLCSLRCGVSITKARQLGQRHCRHIPEGRERKRSGMQALAHAEGKHHVLA